MAFVVEAQPIETEFSRLILPDHTHDESSYLSNSELHSQMVGFNNLDSTVIATILHEEEDEEEIHNDFGGGVVVQEIVTTRRSREKEQQKYMRRKRHKRNVIVAAEVGCLVTTTVVLGAPGAILVGGVIAALEYKRSCSKRKQRV
jgi:hypothetical protein